jgi:hypothetical protein
MKALAILALAALLGGCAIVEPSQRIQRDTFGVYNVYTIP